MPDEVAEFALRTLREILAATIAGREEADAKLRDVQKMYELAESERLVMMKAFDNEVARRRAVEAERDARPEITPEDAAEWVRSNDDDDDYTQACARVSNALRAHARKAVQP